MGSYCPRFDSFWVTDPSKVLESYFRFKLFWVINTQVSSRKGLGIKPTGFKTPVISIWKITINLEQRLNIFQVKPGQKLG